MSAESVCKMKDINNKDNNSDSRKKYSTVNKNNTNSTLNGDKSAVIKVNSAIPRLR